MSPIFMTARRSTFQAVAPAMPMTVTARPICPSVAPNCPRRMFKIRRAVSDKGADRKRARHKTSQTEPARTQAPSVIARPCFPSAPNAIAAAPAITATMAATPSRFAASPRLAALPGEKETERNREQQRHEDPDHRRIEERAADGDLVSRQGLKRHRVERSDEHDPARHRQKQVVENEALSREMMENAVLRGKRAGPPGEQRQALPP